MIKQLRKLKEKKNRNNKLNQIRKVEDIIIINQIEEKIDNDYITVDKSELNKNLFDIEEEEEIIEDEIKTKIPKQFKNEQKQETNLE